MIKNGKEYTLRTIKFQNDEESMRRYFKKIVELEKLGWDYEIKKETFFRKGQPFGYIRVIHIQTPIGEAQ